ncbi:MAG: alpha/beta fold hydrolase [Lachnospiraceae bacterium]|nr:alpha/beta fold hydrolase [Lachnospiraceae bacterium]
MKKEKAVKVLCVALCLVLVSSILAMLFNTGFGKTRVKRISFDTATGTLSGLLYIPKDASASNPKPTVIVTHGYLNSAEMQDANAIELSRRGYVVLALDMYDHGHSKANEEAYTGTDFFGLWSTFWIHSMYDAVQYMYAQDYVLKDSAGNGIIGVTGHSMGGFSSTMALALDEQDAATSGIRKIHAGLTEGSDFMYTGLLGITAEVADAAGGGRIMGKVAAHYDEFFFNDPAETGGTVRYKDYVSTPDGLTFLQQTSAAANTWYNTSDGGMRIIYEPSQTHPWNHFSKTTTAYAIEFYTKAFEGYQSGITSIVSSSQIWMFKELCELIALIGFVLALVPIAVLLMKLPFLRRAKTELTAPAARSATVASKFATLATLLVAILLPAIFFEGLYDIDVTGSSLTVLRFLAVALAVAGCITFFLSIRAEERKGAYLAGSCFVFVSGLLLAALTMFPLYQDLTFWTAPVVNNIAYWTIAAALISLLVMSVVFVSSKVNDGATFANYGIKVPFVTIIAALCTAVLTVALGYGLLFLIDLVFKTDFRIWTFAFKTFDFNILPAVCRYLPTFFIFYLISTASIYVNTNTESMSGVKGYFLAIAMNAGGIFLWLVRQYGTLFATGVAAHPNAALSGIVLVAMVPTLAIAGILSRSLYKRTGNVWTPAFLNALLMTVMTVANTTVYLK